MRLPTADPQVICCGVAGGAVLLSTEQEVYYGLNTVGAYVWEHLPPVCQTVEQLSAALSALHPDVPVESIRADIQKLLHRLANRGKMLPDVGPDRVEAVIDFLLRGQEHRTAGYAAADDLRIRSRESHVASPPWALAQPGSATSSGPRRRPTERPGQRGWQTQCQNISLPI